MKKLTAAQEKKVEAVVAELRSDYEKLGEAIKTFNEKVLVLWADVETALEDYNGSVRDANEVRQEICDAMQEYFDGKSERWQEGEQGSDYQVWIDEWSNELEEETSIQQPDALDEVPDCCADELEGLSTEV